MQPLGGEEGSIKSSSKEWDEERKGRQQSGRGHTVIGEGTRNLFLLLLKILLMQLAPKAR